MIVMDWGAQIVAENLEHDRATHIWAYGPCQFISALGYLRCWRSLGYIHLTDLKSL